MEDVFALLQYFIIDSNMCKDTCCFHVVIYLYHKEERVCLMGLFLVFFFVSTHCFSLKELNQLYDVTNM